jgi:hypothetical protein
LNVKRDSGVDGVYLSNEGVTCSILVPEDIVACAVARIASGCKMEETA